MSKEQELVEKLVGLAILANTVTLKGTFPGNIADDVHLLLASCENIYECYVQSESSDGGDNN